MGAGSVAVVGLLTSACSFGGSVQNLPLPGGANSGKATYTVTVYMQDVQDLVPKAFVRVNDVAVGEVDSIKLDTQNFQAKVLLKLQKDVNIPANTEASLDQTSLLGEKFVALAPAASVAPQGRLAEGAVIKEDVAEQYPEVEDLFAAFSDLNSGGGLVDIETIVDQLSTALAGHEQNVRSLLTNLTAIIQGLDSSKGQVVRAINGLNSLTKSLSDQRQDIAAALDDFTPAAGVLAADQNNLTQLLSKLSTLGKIGASVISRSKADTVADLDALAPTLATVAGIKSQVAEALTNLDNLGTAAPNAIRGDYLNLRIQIQVNAGALTALPALPNLPILGPAAVAAAKKSNVAQLLLGGLT